MNDNNEIKPIVQSLSAGAAVPIPVTAEQAMKVAKSQEEYNANIQSLENNGTLAKQDNPNDHIAKAIAVGSAEDKAINASQVNQVNDLVKVVEVKTSPKTVILMILAVVVIVGIIIWELKQYVFK